MNNPEKYELEKGDVEVVINRQGINNLSDTKSVKQVSKGRDTSN